MSRVTLGQKDTHYWCQKRDTKMALGDKGPEGASITTTFRRWETGTGWLGAGGIKIHLFHLNVQCLF